MLLLFLAKIILFILLAVLLLAPGLLLAFLFILQLVARAITKVLGIKRPAPSLFGPFLDSDIRRAFQAPRVIIERSGVAPGMRVLEIGSGSGAYTTSVARSIGMEGAEYALDIQPEMLRQLECKLSRPENHDLRNVMLVESDVIHMPFKNDMFDLVFMVSVLQQISDSAKALAEIRRVLKPGGTLAVTEIMMDPYYSFPSTTRKIGCAAGFIHDVTLGNLWHYTVRFKKPSENAM